MKIHCKPSIIQSVELIGQYEQQLEAARKYCIIALSRGVKHITLETQDGSISGPPVAMLENMSGKNWR